ncbi:MAG: RluA family pseudouridine synthase [Nitrospira sp.]|nr:RluA family pseudouridine synthase [Nitrospira sp.]
MQTEFVISAGEQPKRLDVFLVHRQPKLSRAALQRMISAGWVRINNQSAKPSQKIKTGDVVTFDTPLVAPLRLAGQTASLEILYEDHWCLVLNKPAGVVVHPAPGHWSNTLLNALLDHCARSSETATPGLVHRLDKATSGVMVIPKTAEAHRRLAVQFECHSITRYYEALVWGIPEQPEGGIDFAIGPDHQNPKRTSTRTFQPKVSLTEYQVEEAFGTVAARIVLRPRTGRTHQIRTHLLAIGHPILGDKTYGGDRVGAIGGYEFQRGMLHARKLGFTHPVTNAHCEFTIAAPPDFNGAHHALRQATFHEGGSARYSESPEIC